MKKNDLYSKILFSMLPKPTSWTPLLVLADWAEEQGRELEADGWRWMGVMNRWPYYGESDSKRFWRWDLPFDNHSCWLPANVMAKCLLQKHGFLRSYDGIVDAMKALADGWQELSERGRRRAWAWIPPELEDGWYD